MKFAACNVGEVERDATTAILRATIPGVDTRCNLAIARNVAPCFRAFKLVYSQFKLWLCYIA